MKKSFLAIIGTFMSINSSAMSLESEMKNYFAESNQVITKQLNPENCAIKLGELNETYLNLREIDWSQYKDPKIATLLIQKMFHTRLKIKEQLNTMSKTQSVEESCSSQVRKSFLHLRFLEEYLAKIANLNEDVEVLKGSDPYLLVNPKFKKFELESGDIIISRGNAIISAAIAQIGDQDGHFSHAAMIYIDPKTQVKYAIEAHIEIGSDVLPIDKSYTQDGKVRAIVYRQSNPVLAKKAAELAYNTVLSRKNEKNPILYNFAMDLNDESMLFCSQIPYMAYKNASNGEFKLGQQYLTSFSMKNQNFLRGVGVTAAKTYSPSDIELDGQLELVAEWRNLGRVHQTHRKDAVTNRIYQWMEEGHSFDLSKKSGEAHLVKLIRNLPLFSELVKGSVAPNITTRGLKNMMTLNFVGDQMLDALIERYSEVLDRTGIPMTHQEMLIALEEIKAIDQVKADQMTEWLKTHSGQCYGDSGDSCADQPEKPKFMDYFKK